MECLAIRPLAVVSSNGPTPVTLATAVADTLATVDAAEAALEVVDEAQGHLEAAVAVTLEWTRSITGLLLALSVERRSLKVDDDFLSKGFKPCNTYRSVCTTRESKLKNKPHLITFHKNILLSL